MLKPDPSDPNYKEQMKRYEQDPSGWGPGGAASVVPAPAKEELAKKEPKK